MKKIIVLLMLAGCGFHPIFVGHDVDIYVPPISGINGIDLRNGLNAKFGGQHGPDAQCVLNVALWEPTTLYKGLELTGAATWQELSLRARYDLKCDGKNIASGTERASESYTFSGYLVAANASYNNAVQNMIQVLSEKIGTRAIAATAQYAGKKSDGTK